MVAAFSFIVTRLETPEYNCSSHSPQDWSRLYGDRNVVLGSWSLLLGCLSLIMRFLALIDMLGIFCSGVVFGIQLYMGAVFCSHKTFIVLTSISGFACWLISSWNCVFLVLNRIMELTGMDKIFKGARGTVTIAASTVYGVIFSLLSPPNLPNSRYQTVLPCPMIPGFDCKQYVNYFHQIHNCVIIVAILSLYIVFCGLVNKSAMSVVNKSSNTKRLQAEIFTQATIICVLNVGGAAIFIIMNYIPLNQLMMTTGTIGYQLIHASPSMIYVALNPTVRKELVKMMGVNNAVQQCPTMPLPTLTGTSATGVSS